MFHGRKIWKLKFQLIFWNQMVPLLVPSTSLIHFIIDFFFSIIIVIRALIEELATPSTGTIHTGRLMKPKMKKKRRKKKKRENKNLKRITWEQPLRWATSLLLNLFTLRFLVTSIFVHERERVSSEIISEWTNISVKKELKT